MDISEYFDWGFNIQKHIVLRENLGGLVDQKLDGLLVEFNWFSPLLFFYLNQLLNDGIEGDAFLHLGGRIWKIFLFLKLLLHFDVLIVGKVIFGLVVNNWLTISVWPFIVHYF